MNTVLFVVGPPGVGKTTLVRELLEPDSYLNLKPKWTIGPQRFVCAAGHYSGGTFDGADTVPYNGVQPALDFWGRELWQYQLTILDGDRFSHQGVVAWYRKWTLPESLRLRCLHLVARDETLAARRAARGSNQNPTWLKGRVTKAATFAETQFAESARMVVPMDEVQPAVLSIAVRAWLETGG